MVLATGDVVTRQQIHSTQIRDTLIDQYVHHHPPRVRTTGMLHSLETHSGGNSRNPFPLDFHRKASPNHVALTRLCLKRWEMVHGHREQLLDVAHPKYRGQLSARSHAVRPMYRENVALRPIQGHGAGQMHVDIVIHQRNGMPRWSVSESYSNDTTQKRWTQK